MAKSAIDWKNDGQPVDISKLSPKLAKLWAAYISARKKASAAYKANLGTTKTDFQTAFIDAAREQKLITGDEILAFADRYGDDNLIVAVAKKGRAAKTGGIVL
jgi:hypothetical protein